MSAGLLPVVQRWFATRFSQPSEPQRLGWPAIRAGDHTLIAAPTGSGKTLAAFLHALDRLLAQGRGLEDRTQVLYVSPLKALANDVQKNLQAPLAEIRALDPSLPEVRVLVRSGDTPQARRQAMTRKPPHILVTTPESLYILLTTVRGREMLSTVSTVIVDEIHALARDKRGCHLALSLERLDALVEAQGGRLQRIGLSATQRPIEATAGLLAGEGRSCRIVDAGHLRHLDLEVEVPGSPLQAVCSTETWEEIYGRMVEQIESHRTTLVFVNTRKMTERVAARLSEALGKDRVTSHHGSLSRERRLDAEKRLKAGELRALVATASLELGIDVGEVDLVIQVGPTASIATLLQRVGRAGHGLDRVPKGRLFPLTRDELAASAALLLAVRRGELDRTEQPEKPMDILAQQIVAACAAETWDEDRLYDRFRRAWPYRGLSRAGFDAAVALHSSGRGALLHRDGVQGRLRGTRRARLTAITCGGAIPDVADYRVILDPDDTLVGTVNEDFAIESSIGDVFQLGNASWRVLKIERGTLRVADAKGAPPSLPFWFGEAPARTAELCAALSEVREHGTDAAWLQRCCGLGEAAAEQLAEYLTDGKQALGAMPTARRLVLERFFDETGGQQLVLHSPLGGRINRAFGLALRKRFCTSFGFELQAAANEEAIVLSLGPMHSFALEEVWDYLHPDSARDVLVQALLPAPMFQTRWRWNASRSLLVERFQGGRKVPAPLLRMRADDALAAAFPQVQACPETLPGGPLEVPEGHPIVDQTIADCLREAMDVDGFLAVLRALREGRIERHAVDLELPSPLAEGILNAMPYAFLDDAPLEERRTQAALTAQRGARSAPEEGGALDAGAAAQVRAEAWPDPRDAEELHEALGWMGYLTEAEARPWRHWLEELQAAGRVRCEAGRWVAAEADADPLEQLRGRLEAISPVAEDDLPAAERALVRQLEADGSAMRATLDGRAVWSSRRLLARVRRYTVDRLRRQIEPVGARAFLRFLADWQRATPGKQRHGPRGVAETLEQLAGLEVPARAWEAHVLRLRVEGYQREWLDQLTLSGEFAWCRLWSGGRGPLRNAPMALLPRRALPLWLGLAGPREAAELLGPAAELHAALAARGPQFPTDLQQNTRMLPSQLEDGLTELVGRGLAACDSFAALRQLLVPPSRRRFPVYAVGRWSLLPEFDHAPEDAAEAVARQLLLRYGVVFHRLLKKERLPLPWRVLLRELRRLELRGEVRGGRFVAGMSGEQFALPEAVPALRQARDLPDRAPLRVAAADPLNLLGIVTPEGRVSPLLRAAVEIG